MGAGGGGGFGAEGFDGGLDECGGVVGWECCALCVDEGAATRIAASFVCLAFLFFGAFAGALETGLRAYANTLQT